MISETRPDMVSQKILDEVANDFIKNRIEEDITAAGEENTAEESKDAEESSSIENRIIVVDSIMGSGKTEAMLEMIRNDTEQKFFYVTPYLCEVERVINSTNNRLKQPYQLGKGKLSSLHDLMRDGYDIVTTHALFLTATQETVQLIQDGGYTLILDEVPDVLSDYNEHVKELECKTLKKADVQWLIHERHLSVDDRYNATWECSTEDDFQYSEIVRMGEDGTLRCIDDTLFWEFPVSIINAFQKVYVLTYNFRGTQFDCYLRIHELKYDMLSARRADENHFELCPYVDDLDIRKELSKLINVYEGPYNEIGKKYYSLSVTKLTELKRDEILRISRAMRNVKNHFDVRSSALMWTTCMGKDFHLKLMQDGFRYTRKLTKADIALREEELKKLCCFVACNTRATNDYSDRSTLMYMLNKFVPPEIKKYYARQGVSIDEDVYATNELIQWIWRSRIRNGEPINLYLPSSRMRKLLYDWLGRNDVPENISEAV